MVGPHTAIGRIAALHPPRPAAEVPGAATISDAAEASSGVAASIQAVDLMWGDRLLTVELGGDNPLAQTTLRVGDLVRFSLATRPTLLEIVGGVRKPRLIRSRGAKMTAQVPELGAADAPRESSGDAWRWRRPGSKPSRLARLRLRHEILQALRAWFAERDFLEIDTPCIVPAPSPEPQFQPFGVGPDFLITSPEFQLKRLLVGGCERIFRLGPVFRGGEMGRRHNPEFCLLEWYRVDAGLDDLARDLESLLGAVKHLAESLTEDGRLVVAADPFVLANLAGPASRDSNTGLIPSAGADQAGGAASTAPRVTDAEARAAVDLAPPFRRMSVADCFREYLGIEIGGITSVEPLLAAAANLTESELPNSGLLATGGSASGLSEDGPLPLDFERAFFALWTRFEHQLGRHAPLLVQDWPAPLASLARNKPGDATVAERMELFVGGMELANGFAELTDADEQRRRFERDLADRAAQGLPALPLDERFLGALAEGMPPAAGMALGFERLMMLLAGTTEIREVLPFAWDER